MNQLNNKAKSRNTNLKDLQLLDAYSFATLFFLFSIIIVLALTNPENEKSTFSLIILLALVVYSLIMVIVFTALMFKPQKMSQFKEFLSYPSDSKKGQFLRFIFVLSLWFSLPITFLIGIVDSSSKLTDNWRNIVQVIGFYWLLIVPLLAVLWLLYKRHQRFKINTKWLFIIKEFCQSSWRNIKAAFIKSALLQFLLIAIIITTTYLTAFLLPVFDFLPVMVETNSLLKALWQVHAAILGFMVAIVIIIITVIANEKDRTRTWKIYAEKTRFVQFIWFNLLAIISEGVASFQTSQAVSTILPNKMNSLIISEGLIFVSSILMAACIFTYTMKFLDDDYIEDLAEKRIIYAMPDVVEADLESKRKLISKLQGDSNGH